MLTRERPRGRGDEPPAEPACAVEQRQPRRYRTHGRTSVATVRGTRWATTESCGGTRTTVAQGSVVVRDRGARRQVVVRAGHSYLARARA
jgi:ferric-dicitrate binding protein FerR (iron transport regulator)